MLAQTIVLFLAGVDIEPVQPGRDEYSQRPFGLHHRRVCPLFHATDRETTRTIFVGIIPSRPVKAYGTLLTENLPVMGPRLLAVLACASSLHDVAALFH